MIRAKVVVTTTRRRKSPLPPGEQWPSHFVTAPQRGEFVESSIGRKLPVRRVTHLNTEILIKAGNMMPPQIEVELVG